MAVSTRKTGFTLRAPPGTSLTRKFAPPPSDIPINFHKYFTLIGVITGFRLAKTTQVISGTWGQLQYPNTAEEPTSLFLGLLLLPTYPQRHFVSSQ